MYGIFAYLGGGFKYVLFSSLFGEDFQFDQCFSDGLKLNHQLATFAPEFFMVFM